MYVTRPQCYKIVQQIDTMPGGGQERCLRGVILCQALSWNWAFLITGTQSENTQIWGKGQGKRRRQIKNLVLLLVAIMKIR